MMSVLRGLRLAVAGVVMIGGVLVLGCEKEEKILDVEAPGGGIEIRRTDDDFKVELQDEDGESKEIHIHVDDKD